MQTSNTALSLLKTWLNAVEITFLTDGNDLIVADARGGAQTVKVMAKGETAAPGEVAISGPELTGRKLQQGLEAFHALQLSLGYEAKTPVDRGAIPEKKLANGAEFELVAFRHSEFRRCPNPAKTKFVQYKAVIEKSIWRFLRSNQALCADNMMGVDDLRTFAQVWTVNYCGLYELDRAEDTAKENERLLYTHLSQRFQDFRAILLQKSRNVLPALDDAFIGTRGRTYDYNDFTAWEADDGEDDEEDSEYVARHRQLDTSDPQTRRASAARLLEQALAGLDHDELVETLTAAMENGRIHPDARAEATRRLERHRGECSGCGEAMPKTTEKADAGECDPVVEE